MSFMCLFLTGHGAFNSTCLQCSQHFVFKHLLFFSFLGYINKYAGFFSHFSALRISLVVHKQTVVCVKNVQCV